MKYDFSNLPAAVDAMKREKVEEHEKVEGGNKSVARASIDDLIEEVKAMKAQEAARINAMIAQDKISGDDVRKILGDLSREGYTQFVRDVLCACGARKFSEVDPRDYASILRAVNAEFYEEKIADKSQADEPQLNTDEPQLNSSGNSPQDYTTAYALWRKNRETPKGKKIISKFGLDIETARKFDLGVTSETLNGEKQFFIVYSGTNSFFQKFTPEPIFASNTSGKPKDISVQNSYGSIVEPFNLAVFDSNPSCVFVTTDVRDMLAIENFGFRATCLNNNNKSKKKLVEKIKNTKYNGGIGLFFSTEKTHAKMKDIKAEIEKLNINVDLISLNDGNGTFYEGLKKDHDGVIEALCDFYKKHARKEPSKNTTSSKIKERHESKAEVVPAPQVVSPSLEIQSYDDAFEALPDHSFASEHDEMASLIEFIEEVLPEPHLFIRIPNELARNHQEGWKFKEEGLRAGVPDYFYAFPCGHYSGLWIEMKRKDGGEVSHSQQQYLDLLSKMKYMTAVCHGVEEAKKAIIKYLANRE